MRALVTGATGYIGYHVARHLLAENWEVHALIRPGTDRRRLATLSAVSVHTPEDSLQALANLFAQIVPDAVMHLAAAPPGDGGDLDRLIDGNVVLPTRLAAAMRAAPSAVLVHAASWWEWDAAGAFRPANLYAATKASGRIVLDSAARTTPFRMASLVLHDVYGPRDWRGKIVTAMVRAAVSGDEIDLSPGDQEMDLVHVDDVAHAFRHTAVMLAQADADRAPSLFRVATGQPISLRGLAASVEVVCGRPVKARWGARGYQPNIPMRPGDMAPLLTEWRPETALGDGLAQVAAELEE